MSPLVDFEEWEVEQLRDLAFVAAVAEREPAFQVTRLRILHGLTQAQRATITQTRTWELRGTLEVAEPEPEYIVGRDEQGRPITNYAEHVDELLYPQMPTPLRKQAHAVAKLRGETVSDVVRLALKDYVQEALDDARDHRELSALVARIDAGLEPLHDHDDVWARIEALEAQGALPD